MRKAAGSRFALALGLMAFTACQSADRSPVGSSPTEPGQDQAGTARAAVDPIPVPGKPAPIPVPGRGGSTTTTKIPVPGGPSKGPAPGSPATPVPPGSPGTPGPTPTPAPVTLTFTSSDTPALSTTTTFPSISSLINVSGITGQVLNIIIAFRATIPDNIAVDLIRVNNPRTAPQLAGAGLFSDASGKLSGANLGTSCTERNGATTFDEKPGVGGGKLIDGAPPYSSVYISEVASLQALTALTRTPPYANGDWELELLFEAGSAPARLECWSITLEYRPS